MHTNQAHIIPRTLFTTHLSEVDRMTQALAARAAAESAKEDLRKAGQQRQDAKNRPDSRPGSGSHSTKVRDNVNNTDDGDLVLSH